LRLLPSIGVDCVIISGLLTWAAHGETGPRPDVSRSQQALGCKLAHGGFVAEKCTRLYSRYAAGGSTLAKHLLANRSTNQSYGKNMLSCTEYCMLEGR
jgi:hypothetical protein